MSIEQAKSMINSLIGKNLKIAVNKGRKKIVKYDGCVSGVFPSVFTVSIVGDHPVNRLSYSYSDLICGNVRLKEK